MMAEPLFAFDLLTNDLIRLPQRAVKGEVWVFGQYLDQWRDL
jgi:hypothetical protein